MLREELKVYWQVVQAELMMRSLLDPVSTCTVWFYLVEPMYISVWYCTLITFVKSSLIYYRRGEPLPRR